MITAHIRGHHLTVYHHAHGLIERIGQGNHTDRRKLRRLARRALGIQSIRLTRSYAHV